MLVGYEQEKGTSIAVPWYTPLLTELDKTFE